MTDQLGRQGLGLHARLLAAALFWGGTFVAGRVVVRELGPFSASFLRFAAASALLAGVCLRRDPAVLRPTAGQLFRYALLGFVGIFAYNWFFLEALKHVPAGRAAVVTATNPAFTALLAMPIFGESLGWRKGAGIGLALCGTLTVLTHGRPWAILTDVSPQDLLMVAAMGSWVGYSLLGKWAMQLARPLGAVTWSCILGAGMLLPGALAEGLPAAALHASLTAWGCVLYMGVLATVLSFLWYYRGIQALGAGRASAYINFVPVFAALLGWLLLGEGLDAATAAGGGMVIAGVWQTNRG